MPSPPRADYQKLKEALDAVKHTRSVGRIGGGALPEYWDVHQGNSVYVDHSSGITLTNSMPMNASVSYMANEVRH